MPLFQPSVVKKYIQDLDKVAIQKLFAKFTEFFGNAERQQNIRELKEEQFQEGFLRNLFVDILGYTINPEPNYNLLTEQKNEKDSKKADGAILKQTENETNVIAVIELKGTDTTDLAKVENQAFGYKNNQKSCVYVITSNFEKIRFYIDNAIDFEEFNLFHLTEEQFQLMFLCLAKDNLLNNIPQRIKEASVSQEDHITKKLYADYSAFKKVLFANITELNPEFDKLTLFKKTQKLLDRFLFIFFAEDRLLLPPNSIRAIVEQWEKLKELDEYKPLYERFIKYFGYLNVGHKGQNFDIFAYNGGLFLPDDILDNIKIDDELLREHTIKLSNYDFDTEVDVNILGHIFEHSLNEIEEVQSELEGKAIDSNKSKRKKDGVYYTPKYITKYIVENTVGALCSEKKKELEINEDEIVISNRKNKKKELLDKIDIYRNWLLKLTICDPACGSGAFLNQALDFLINEHKKLDELIARITNSPIVFSDIENSILENNIFGVDINEEAVEIAKLSLWLKTAKKGRKLSKISNNIKCGNSLIDDPEVAGEKAFNWFVEFPQVFPFYRDKDKHTNDNIKKDIIRLGLLNYPDQGDFNYTDEISEPVYSYKPGSKGFEKYGFDVVIGNPPYFSVSTLNKNDKAFYKKKFELFDSTGDIYCLFIEKSLCILKQKGFLSLITSDQWLQANYGIKVRNLLVKLSNPTILIDFAGFKVFQDATVDTSIIISVKENCNNYLKGCQIKSDYSISDNLQSYIESNFNILSDLNVERWQFINNESQILKHKIKEKGKELKDWNIKINYGIKTGFNEAFIITNEKKVSLCKENPRINEIIKPILRGRDVHKYSIEWADLWLIVSKNGVNIKDEYKEVYNFFESFGDLIKNRTDQGDKWWNLRACSYYEDFEKPKIIYPETTVRRGEFYIDTDNYYIDKTCFMITGDNLEYLNAILSSKLMEWYLETELRSLGKTSIQYSKQYIEKVPIPENIINAKQFVSEVELIKSKSKNLLEIKTKFIKLLNIKYSNFKISNKIENWLSIDFKMLLAELEKQKIKLSIVEQSEWLEYFEREKGKAAELQNEIAKINKEIDQMVYELYGLTEDEIRVVEEGEASI